MVSKLKAISQKVRVRFTWFFCKTIVIFRPKAALNYPSTKNRDQCLFVCPSQIFDGFIHIQFWWYLANQAQKLRKILSVLKIFFSSSGKNLTDSKDISDDSRDFKVSDVHYEWSIQWNITSKRDYICFPCGVNGCCKKSCFELFVYRFVFRLAAEHI